MQQLNRESIENQLIKSQSNLNLPSVESFKLPEKILQFGTGVLLRGLIDSLIDNANHQGLFNGRIVTVQSTSSGRGKLLNDQDGLFTLRVEGFDKGHTVKEYQVVSSISRVISAKDHWNTVLECASNPDMSVIVSNTTEVGLQYHEDDITQQPPSSFPGKLLAFLYERYKQFEGTNDSGFVIIPCELIVDNGHKLKEVLEKQARHNNMDENFIQWLLSANKFCNSLVDRIVPGSPDEEKYKEITGELGYEDPLLTISEVYRLWAIEADEETRKYLPFKDADKGIIVENDITPYRERKLRLLNGTHTISVAAAHLAGFNTVADFMNNDKFEKFIIDVMHNEIVPATPVDFDNATEFADEVMDRFRNPFLNHKVLNITLQYTSKMNMRNVPTIRRYYDKYKKVPELMAFGFAAYLYFLRPQKEEEGYYYGFYNGEYYLINDDKASYFYQLWKDINPDDFHDIAKIVKKVLTDTSLWDVDLTTLGDFKNRVENYLQDIHNNGVMYGINNLLHVHYEGH